MRPGCRRIVPARTVCKSGSHQHASMYDAPMHQCPRVILSLWMTKILHATRADKCVGLVLPSIIVGSIPEESGKKEAH